MLFWTLIFTLLSDLQDTIDIDSLLEIHGGNVPLPKLGHELNLLDDLYSGKKPKKQEKKQKS